MSVLFYLYALNTNFIHKKKHNIMYWKFCFNLKVLYNFLKVFASKLHWPNFYQMWWEDATSVYAIFCERTQELMAEATEGMFICQGS